MSGPGGRRHVTKASAVPVSGTAPSSASGGRTRTCRRSAWALSLGFVTAAVFAQADTSRRETRFPILAFNVVGNSVLSADEIETAIYPFLGEDKSFADAERARGALERAYQSRGFLSVAVVLPPQAVVDDELTLQVVEARIDARRVTNAQYNLPGEIAAATPSIAPGNVPDFNALQSELAQLQTGADLQVTPVVLGAANDPNRLDVELKVQDRLPLHGAVELNSKQTYNSPRGRLESSLRYDNLFQSQHSAGLTWIVAPEDLRASSTIVASYGVPFGQDRLNMVFVASDSTTPTSVGGATVTNGRSLGGRYRMALPGAEPGVGHGWTLGIDFKDNRDVNQDVAGVSTQTPALRYPVFSAGYDIFDVSSPTGQLSFDAAVVFGIAEFGARQVDCNGQVMDQFACKRAGASPSFQLLRMNLQGRRRVFGDWDASLAAQVQFASAPLTSAEQIGAGGYDSVRGYYEFEQVGDQGVVLRAELASPTLVNLGPVGFSGLVFGHHARLRVNQALPGEQSDISMGSVGLGIRGRSGEGLALSLDLSLPLIDTLKADSTGALVPTSGRNTPNSKRVDLLARYGF